MKIVVVGAGAFGGWLALFLLRKGFEVILVDGHGAGNARSSSGDETRVIRSVYKDEIYARFAQRSMKIWQEHEADKTERFFFPIGVLNLIGRDESRWLAARHHLDKLGISYDLMDTTTLVKKYSCISPTGLNYAVLEKSGGYLRARRGCESVVEQFISLGGNYLRAFINPVEIEGGKIRHLTTISGEKIEGDHFVLAAGSWLGQLMPEKSSAYITPTRQDLYYFGMPQSAVEKMSNLPVWCDFSSLDDDVMYYGIPANDMGSQGFGFKIGEDVAGPVFDPESGERAISKEGLERARHFMHQRFPCMAGAPLLQSRVCQYENSPDAHLISDKLPGYENLWVLGGGSGHGYKLGAAVGEYMAGLMAGDSNPEPILSFERFSRPLDQDKRR